MVGISKLVVPWSTVYVELAREWSVGQHMMICAPTGVGKSVIAQEVVSLRTGVVVLGTKRKDDSMDAYLKRGYIRIKTWPPAKWGREPFRYVLWPDIKTIDDVVKARPTYAKFLRQIFEIDNVTIVLDECQFMTQHLGLGRLIALLLHQGRSGKLSVVSLSQRPVWIPADVRSASSFAFLGRTTDRSDLSALVDFGGADRAMMRSQLMSLDSDKHELLFARSRKPWAGEITVAAVGTRLRSQVERAVNG